MNRLKTLVLAALLLSVPPAAPAEMLPPGAPVDTVLDALDTRGDGLRDFSADVAMTDVDAQTGNDTKRIGNVVFDRKADGDVRMKIEFLRKVQDGTVVPERIIYLLEEGWLTDRSYPSKTEVRRQVLEPGQKIDLLKLGEGPFPLPIGQDKDEVKKQFEVKQLPVEEGIEAEDADKLKDTIHLKLVPKEGTQIRDQFREIDVWVDRDSHMPARITTLSASGLAVQVTDLTKVRINQGVKDEQFQLEPVEGWQRRDEPFQR